MLQLIIMVVLTAASGTSGENPGFQVTLNNKGLQYAKHAAGGWIHDRLSVMTLPDIDKTVLNIHYTLSDIRIKKCDFPEPSVQFDQNHTGVQTSIIGLSVALNGSWSIQFGLIHDSGQFDLALFGVDVTSVVNLGKDVDGRLSVTSVSCQAAVGKVQVDFYGASWVSKGFLWYFKRHVSGLIQTHICSKVEEFIMKEESHLQALNVTFALDPFISLNLSLTDSPEIDSTSLNLPLKGQFYCSQTQKEPPFVASPFTLPKHSSYMLTMGVSDFMLNSASYAYYINDVFTVNIDDQMIPPSWSVRLNTSSMGPYVPQLPHMFPNLLMQLHVCATDFPLFSFHPAALQLFLQFSIQAYAILPNTTLTPLFKLHVTVNVTGKMWISNERLKGSVKMNNFTLTLVGSEVGSFKTTPLEKLLKNGLTTVILPRLNKRLGQGVVLPRMKNVQLVSPTLTVEEGFIAVASDFQILLTDGRFNWQNDKHLQEKKQHTWVRL